MKKKFKCLIIILISIVLLTIVTNKVSSSAIAQTLKSEISNKFKSPAMKKGNSNKLSITTLVNKTNPSNYDFIPSKLVKVKVSFAPKTPKEEMMMTAEAAAALKNMFAAASEDDIKLLGVSGYRSYKSQENLYTQKLNSNGRDYVDRYVAIAGQSEHQTGLAMDVDREIKKGSQFIDFSQTKEGIWIKNNAYTYGFILRYPKGKEDITGYNYEPWHIRYVGKKAAKEIKSKGLVLEEYL